MVKAPDNMPHYSFGTNLGSDIASKNHIRPEKTDQPGPGSYEDKDVQFKKPAPKIGKDARKDLSKKDNFPGPNNYDPIHETE